MSIIGDGREEKKTKGGRETDKKELDRGEVEAEAAEQQCTAEAAFSICPELTLQTISQHQI